MGGLGFGGFLFGGGFGVGERLKGEEDVDFPI